MGVLKKGGWTLCRAATGHIQVLHLVENPLVSRTRIFELKALTDEAIRSLMELVVTLTPADPGGRLAAGAGQQGAAPQLLEHRQGLPLVHRGEPR